MAEHSKFEFQTTTSKKKIYNRKSIFSDSLFSWQCNTLNVKYISERETTLISHRHWWIHLLFNEQRNVILINRYWSNRNVSYKRSTNFSPAWAVQSEVVLHVTFYRLQWHAQFQPDSVILYIWNFGCYTTC